MTLGELRKEAYDAILPISDESARYEADMIISSVLSCTKAMLLAHSERVVKDSELNIVRQYIERRINGEPVQYIIGRASFMGYDFYINKDVLIPRPDTEVLVEQALPFCCNADVLDMCTGSGCIAAVISLKSDKANVCASDISEAALIVAEHNIKALGAAVTLYKGSYADALPEGALFDVIVSNPPYISGEEMQELSQEVLYEPHMALYGGEDGLEPYRIITSQVRKHLKQGGKLLFEIGYTQAKDVCDIMSKFGYKEIRTVKDYGGRDRVVIGEL